MVAAKPSRSRQITYIIMRNLTILRDILQEKASCTSKTPSRSPPVYCVYLLPYFKGYVSLYINKCNG